MRTVYISVILIVAFLALPGIGHAEDGVLADGQRIKGTLSTDVQGRVVFQASGEQPPLRLDQLDQVRFPASHLPPLRAGAVCRVLFQGEQRLTGEFLGLDSDKLQLRTIWSELLSIPRAGVTAVSHAPGFVTLFVDNFEKDLKCWRVTGAPSLSSRQHTSGQRSLYLDTPGQQVEYTLPTPLRAGRVGINFYDRAQEARMAWCFEADFGDSAGGPTVRVGVQPQTGAYTAEVFGAAPAKRQLPRALLAFPDGWQRLGMEFGPVGLMLSIDDTILYSCRAAEFGGPLRKVRLSCTHSPSRDHGGAGVFFDDFSVARAVPDLPHPKGDPKQDELWLLGGDQLFGNLIGATGSRIDLRGNFGPRSFRWAEVRGIYLRHHPASAQKVGAPLVRVWLHSGIGFEPDVLNGTVRRLDAQRLVLDQELFGRVEIDRQRVHRIGALTEERMANERLGR